MIARLALIVAVVALASPATASALPDEPDLTISLPSVPYDRQVAPVYVDTFEEPGRVLYRFDAVITNEGGTLDLFGDDTTVGQAIWPGGRPTTAPHPEQPPPAGTPRSERTPTGARFEYVVEHTHAHWHYFTAARYELLVPGAAARVSGKIGFCMFDSFDLPEEDGASYFPWDAPGSDTWCRFSQPDSDFVRMGLSPGKADRYASQREFQYVDVTGLAPGEYRLRAIANPGGHLLEADGVPDVHEEARVVPGVRAGETGATTAPGQPVAVELTAAAVGTDIPARRDGECEPRADSTSCYRWADAEDPLTYAIASAPRHGTASLDGSRATYTPAAGFTGTDRFTYTATDARGLRSLPTKVEVVVAATATTPADGGAQTGPTGAGATMPQATTQATRRLLRILGARRTSRRRLAVRIRCRPAAATSCAGTVTAKVAGRRLGRRRYADLATGRARTVRIRLRGTARAALRRHPRRRLLVVASVRDAAGHGASARRTFRLRE